MTLLHAESSKGSNIRDNDKLFFPENEILPRAKSDAKKLEAHRMNKRKGDISKKVEELLREAAMMYARLGEMTQCCTILIDLGDWTTALALAPSVSLEYWQELTEKYADHLATTFSENCIPHLVAIKRYQEAVDFYVKRRDYHDALIVAKASDFSASSASPIPQRNNEFENDKSENDMKTRVLIENVIIQSAKQYLEENLPIVASAQYLRIGDAQSAVQLLSVCSEYELAFAISDCLGLDTKNCIVNMADKCAALGNLDLALSMLNDIDKNDEEVGLLLSRCCNYDDLDKYEKRYFKDGLQYWVNRAVEEETIGNDGDAVLALVISRQFKKAVSYGMLYLKKFIREPLDLSATGRKVLKGLKYVNVSDLDEPQKLPFLCHMLWFCAHEAVEMKQWETGVQMLRVLEIHCSKFPFTLSSDDVAYQSLFFRILGGDYSVEKTLNELQEKHKNLIELSTSFRTIRSLIRDETAGSGLNSKDVWGANTGMICEEVQRLGESLLLPSLTKLVKPKSFGSLPQLHVTSKNSPSLTQSSMSKSISHLSGKRITGKVIQLGTSNDESMYHMSAHEAQAWRRFNPYSPQMNGELIPV